jgi:hypothetical protein
VVKRHKLLSVDIQPVDCVCSFCCFVDNKFFDRLLNKSAAGPLTRGDLDVSAVGDNSNFWVDICTAFKDCACPMPPLPTNNNIFIDRKTRQDKTMISHLVFRNG